MHVRHEALFRWLVERFPATRLYGPYHHGGRSYYQWMARGRRSCEDPPLLEEELDRGARRHAAERLRAMRERYAATSSASGSASTGDGGPASRVRDGRHDLRSAGAASKRSRVATAWRPTPPGNSKPARELLADDPLAPTAVRDPARSSTTTWPTRSWRSSSTEIRSALARSRTWARAPGFPGCRWRSRCPEAAVCLVESSRAQVRRSSSARSRRAGSTTRGRPRAGGGLADGLGRIRRGHRPRARAARLSRRVRRAAAAARRDAGRVARTARPGARRAAAEPRPNWGWSCAEPRACTPYPGAEHRHLHLMLKVMETPAGFPRRRDGAQAPIGAVLGCVAATV